MQNRTPAEKLLELMKALGFDSAKGACIGLSMMAINAFLCGEFANYIEQLKIINDTPELATKINAVKNKIATQQPLSETEKVYFSILTLVKDIHSILYPEKIKTESEKQILRFQYEKIFKVIASEKLKQQGGLSAIKSWIGMYDQTELNDFVNLLEQHALKHNENLALTLEDDSHEIALCYDVKTKQWSLLDTIQLKAINITSQQVAAEIFKAFGNKANPIALTTNVFATNAKAKTLKRITKEISQTEAFKTLHQINEQKAQAKTEFGLSLLQLAARNGFANTVRDLLSNGAKPDDKMLLLAAQNGHHKVIEELHGKVNFNAASASGATPIFIAAQEGRVKAVRVLAKRGANVNSERTGGWKPVIIAAKHGHAKAVRTLVEYKADIACINQAGQSAADFAITNNDVCVLKVLAESGSPQASKYLQTKFNLFQPMTKPAPQSVSARCTV